MKHYGIYDIRKRVWCTLYDGCIFWTTSKSVAKATLKQCYNEYSKDGLLVLIIKEFSDEE